MSKMVSAVMRTREIRLPLLVVRVFILNLCDTGKLIRVNGDSIMGSLRADRCAGLESQSAAIFETSIVPSVIPRQNKLGPEPLFPGPTYRVRLRALVAYSPQTRSATRRTSAILAHCSSR